MLTVVLIHWNQPERCEATIEAFGSQGVDLRIVVVDNGSERAARARLLDAVRRSPHRVEVVSLFLRASADDAGEWVAVAPHDALPQPGALATMVALGDADPTVGLVSADVGDGHVPIVDPYFGGMTRPARQEVGLEPAAYPHGTLFLARRGCLDDVGVFDEAFFAYCEEADLGLRATAGGWAVGLAHGARVVNPGMRAGSPVADYLMHRNTLRLVRRWSGRYHATIRLLLAVGQLVRGLVQPSSRAWMFSAEGRVRGIVDHLRGRYGPPPASLVRAGEDEWSRTETQPHEGVARIDPATGEASSVPAIGGGARLGS
jgi:GT2 family glycosyltransferase